MTAYNELISFTDSFIRDNKKITPDGYAINVNEFRDWELEEFAAQLINYESCEKEGWDWLLEDAYRDELAGTFAAMILSWRKGEKEELKIALIESLKQSAIKTHKSRMQSWIDTRIGIVEREDDYERANPCDCEDAA